MLVEPRAELRQTHELVDPRDRYGVAHCEHFELAWQPIGVLEQRSAQFAAVSSHAFGKRAGQRVE